MMAKKPTKQTETVKVIKGFDADLKCRGFQYEIGATYEHKGDVIVCSSGFHACKGSPFDVWGYYGPVDPDGRLSRYAEATAGGVVRKSGSEDSKVASAKITIDAEIALPDFVRRAVAWVIDATKGKEDDPSGYYAQIGSSGYYAQIGSSGYSAQIGSSGYYAKIGSSGDYAKIGSSGDYAKIGSSGYYAQIGSSGDYAKIGSSGYYAKIGSSGDYAKIGSSGDYAKIGSSGYYAQIGSSGDYAKIGSSGYSAKIGSSGYSAQIGSSGDSAEIGSSGYYAKIVAEGKDSVVSTAGPGATVSGAQGTWLSLAEYKNGKCVGFATGCIGADGLKPNTPYVAKGGKLIPASDQ